MMSRRGWTRRSTGAIALAALLAGATAAHARQAPEPFKKNPETPSVAGPQGFSVVLLLGDVAPGVESQDGIPAAARRALVDMKDFLPYKSFRLLDSQWTLCCSGSTSVITRLRGVDDQEYELELRATLHPDMRNFGGNASELSTRFVLRESDSKVPIDRTKDKVASAAVDARVAQIHQEVFALERERADLALQSANFRKQVDVGMKDPAEKRRVDEQLGLVVERINVLKRELGAISMAKGSGDGRPVIDTSFRMNVGETVVVGTSRLKGGTRALIALLTAVGPRKDAPKDSSKK